MVLINDVLRGNNQQATSEAFNAPEVFVRRLYVRIPPGYVRFSSIYVRISTLYVRFVYKVPIHIKNLLRNFVNGSFILTDFWQ